MNLARVAVPGRYAERSAFDRLVDRYHRQAYNVAYRMTGNHADAEDLTQESFLRAYRFFDRYDPTLPFENWLYRIMSRVLVDEIRKRPKAPHQSLYQRTADGDTVCMEIEDTQPNPEQQVLSEALDDYLQDALNTLPHVFRVAVILADVEGLSYEDIAEATGTSAGTVRSRLHRGRKLLRQRIDGASHGHGAANGVTSP